MTYDISSVSTPLTCVLAGELGHGVAHPPRALAVGLVTAVLAVLVAVAAPAFRNARLVGTAMELLGTALHHHGGQGCKP